MNSTFSLTNHVYCLWSPLNYRDGKWQHLEDTISVRRWHTSVTIRDRVLLIGGEFAKTTEFIPVDGTGASPGPFEVKHLHVKCAIKISDDVVVMTGGAGSPEVTEYHLADGRETALTPLTQGRDVHTCAVYQDTDGQQVSAHKICRQFQW